MPTTDKKDLIGNGLIISGQSASSLSNEMAALEAKNQASPGLKKQRLDSNNQQHQSHLLKLQEGPL